MSYERTVAAAVSETRSKFALAEALAIDIPPRRRGPKVGPEFTVTEHLTLAQVDIVRAGGEARSVQTLGYYRDTALWVSTGSGRNFRWVKGVSFTAHTAAREAGLSYEEFAANPKRTIRREPRPATPEQVRSALVDPEIVDEVMADPKVRAAAGQALDRHYDRDRELRQRETPTAPPSTDDYTVEVLMRLRAITTAIKAATDVILTGPQMDATDDLVAVVDWQLNALGIIRDALAGRSGLDAELAKILREG